MLSIINRRSLRTRSRRSDARIGLPTLIVIGTACSAAAVDGEQFFGARHDRSAAPSVSGQLEVARRAGQELLHLPGPASAAFRKNQQRFTE